MTAEEMLQAAARREGQMLAQLDELQRRLDRMEGDIERRSERNELKVDEVREAAKQEITRLKATFKTAYGGFTTLLLFIAGLYFKQQGLW